MQGGAIVSKSSDGVFEGQSEPDVIVLTNFIAEDNSHENRCCARRVRGTCPSSELLAASVGETP